MSRNIESTGWHSRIDSVLRSFIGSVLLFSLPIAVVDTVQAAANSRQALTTSILRVCADPANLPFSNEAEEGLENRLVQMIGDALDREVRYTWFPQSIGFVRSTLRLRHCDLISGITTTSELVQNTNPYYHSVYTMVYRADSGLDIERTDDPALRDKRLGVVAGTPPATLLMQQGLMANATPYHLVADTRAHKPARQAILDVDEGTTDVAFVWGPLAAWYAARAGNELVVVPLVQENPRVRLDFRVSMAVRYGETDWKRRINDVLADLEPEIDALLREYGVPLLNDRGEVVFSP